MNDFADTITTDFDSAYREEEPRFKRRRDAWALLAITVLPWLLVALIVHLVWRWV
jgi:hypothetical protein